MAVGYIADGLGIAGVWDVDASEGASEAASGAAVPAAVDAAEIGADATDGAVAGEGFFMAEGIAMGAEAGAAPFAAQAPGAARLAYGAAGMFAAAGCCGAGPRALAADDGSNRRGSSDRVKSLTGIPLNCAGVEAACGAAVAVVAGALVFACPLAEACNDDAEASPIASG